MKHIKLIILSCMLLGVLLLSGCGIEVSTDMKINESFEGTRTISCFVSNQDMALHFNDDIETIDTMIENHCPGCFETSKNVTENGTEYIFVLRFSSLEDYKTQLNSILNFSPEINYTGINSIFSQSFKLTENFTTLDLLRWFEILLTEEYSIDETRLTSIWNIKNTKVTWQDKNYTLKSDKITISDHVSSPFEGISIFTEEHEKRNFTRRIQFAIPKETLDKRLHELEAYFDSLKPEGTTGIWTTTASGKIYEMTFQAETFEKLSEITSSILKKNSGNSASSNISILPDVYSKLVLEYSENLDFSHFLSTENGEVPVSYYFKPNPMTELDSERLQREINNAFIPKEYENGYYRIFSGNCSTLKIKTIGTLTLPVTSYSVHTTLKKENQIAREFHFAFADILTEKEKELYSSILSSNSTDILSMSLEENNGNMNLVLKQRGTEEELNTSSTLLFGLEKPSIQIKKEGFFFSLLGKKELQIVENLDLTKIIGPNAETASGTYELQDNYFKNIQTFTVNEEDQSLSYDESLSTSMKSASFTGSTLHAEYTCTHFSPYGILLLITLGTMGAAGYYYYNNKNKRLS